MPRFRQRVGDRGGGVRDGRAAFLGQGEAGREGSAQAGGLAVREVLRIGGEDFGCAGAQRLGHGEERRIALFGRAERDLARGSAGTAA